MRAAMGAAMGAATMFPVFLVLLFIVLAVQYIRTHSACYKTADRPERATA
jgi:hypothetical protein